MFVLRSRRRRARPGGRSTVPFARATAACGRLDNSTIRRRNLVAKGVSPMQTQFLNPPSLCPTFGWTHVVTATGGKTIYISGQVSVDERGAVVGKGDLQAQAEQTFKNLQHALAAVGASFHDVVKTNLYVVGLKPGHVRTLRGGRGGYVNTEQPPASTLVGVSALVGVDWLIEIEAVAVLPE